MKTRNFKTSLLIMMRHAGMLCKRPQPESPRIRVAATVFPDGTIESRPYGVTKSELTNDTHSIQNEIHIWIEAKKAAVKDCQFDSATKSCPCGKTLDAFAVSGCIKAHVTGSLNAQEHFTETFKTR